MSSTWSSGYFLLYKPFTSCNRSLNLSILHWRVSLARLCCIWRNLPHKVAQRCPVLPDTVCSVCPVYLTQRRPSASVPTSRSSSSALSCGYRSLYRPLTSSSMSSNLSTFIIQVVAPVPVYLSQCKPSESYPNSYSWSSTWSSGYFSLYKPLTSSNKSSNCASSVLRVRVPCPVCITQRRPSASCPISQPTSSTWSSGNFSL
mmetsp:Transcript_55654/g.140824  ORF Transcript_55654/g.140824 Transcript_55654/m.140824 type:complete len:202 (-) Transcript_55654:2202-2807(-)